MSPTASDLTPATGPLYSEIGRVLARDVGPTPVETLLYAEAAPGVVAPSIFQEYSDRVRYVDGSFELSDRIADAWWSEPEGRRWYAMVFRLKDRNFTVDFIFDNEIDSKASDDDRREALLRTWYGEKPVDYSDPGPLIREGV